jgi:simple sugar transport system ATP-binding protein
MSAEVLPEPATGDRDAGPAARIAAAGVWKAYGKVLANRDVSLEVARGSVHAVLGENGAGKSTLMKLLYGVEAPDRGEVRIDGAPVTLRSPKDAIAQGVGMVFQHFGLVPGLTAAENIVLGAEPTRATGIDRAAVRTGVAEVMQRFALSVALDDKVAGMSAARQQRVEILKALYRGADVLILDEPTALLTPQERRNLFAGIRQLTDRGTTVLFITHKLAEVEEIADHITVMRAGVVVGSARAAEFDRSALVRLMVGDASILSRRARPAVAAADAEVALSVADLRVRGNAGNDAVDGASLVARRGEVLGLAGVEGNGQLEFLEALGGLREPHAGTIEVGGRRAERYDNRAARRMGIAFVPEDRLATGIAGQATIAENILANRIGAGFYDRRGSLRRRAMRRDAAALVERFGVRCAGIDQAAGSLSGGNVQKVILAREISVEPSVLLVAEPTRGLDVAAIALVHEQLARAAEQGAAVVVLSSDLDELLGIATRIAVFHQGAIVEVFDDVAATTPEQLGRAMLGADRAEVAP